MTDLCRATMIAAPGSHSGKTVVTAALARRWNNQGKRVQVFKAGPDFLDPMLLEQASRQPVYNLDLWVMGEDHCRYLLSRAAGENDIILIESLMGLHDNQPSSAELATIFDIPVTLVLNVAKYAQTAIAIVEGMGNYRNGVDVKAVIGNLVGSDNHHRLMQESMGEIYSGSVRRDDRFAFPERHLGLVQAAEVPGLDRMLDNAAGALGEFEIDIPLVEVSFEKRGNNGPENILQGHNVAIARDDAFSFIYQGNLELLASMGAEIEFFSPLANQEVPDCDSLWLPGGYPERHLATLSASEATRNSIRNHCGRGKPVVAECGGMMYLCNGITSVDGKRGTGCGMLDAECTMHRKFQNIGLESVDYELGQLRGHSFHHSSLECRELPWKHSRNQQGQFSEPVFRSAGMTMSYFHHYFPSNPESAAALFLDS